MVPLHVLDVAVRKHDQMAEIDTLVIVGAMAGNLQVNKATVLVIGPQDGFSEVGYMILTDELKVDNYKFIVLLIGRADLWDTMRYFKQHVGDCLQVI